jgi:hypothetical protein
MWGRYENGNLVAVDRINGTVFGGGPFSAGNNRHFIMSGSQTGVTALPISGTVAYSLMGATRPTDNAASGNFIGILNSATLVANFTAKTVDVGVNATVNGNNWVASANSLPIQKGLFFEAQRNGSSTKLNVACTGSCSSGTLSGNIAGAFIGATGQAAGMVYSFNSSTYSGGTVTSVGQTVTGAAVFKR